jgi:DNA-binding transcriptional regulator YhcF (GntR family)
MEGKLVTSKDNSGIMGLFAINAHAEIPIYKQIINQIKLLIAAGKLSSGDELPSIRALSVPMGVNPMTISKAYNILENEGILDRRPGRSLVIGNIDAANLDHEKYERLRESLADAVLTARQLGVSATKASNLFRDMLLAARDDDTSGRGV